MMIIKLSIAVLLCRYVQWCCVLPLAACQLYIACMVNLLPSPRLCTPFTVLSSQVTPRVLALLVTITGHQMDICTSLLLAENVVCSALLGSLSVRCSCNK